MDLRSLKYFVAAAEEGSISGAAERCFIAQPSISSAINKLESEFEMQLFHRHKKGVTLTEDGTQFLIQAKSLLHHASAIKQQFHGVREQIQVRVKPERSLSLYYLQKFSQLCQQWNSSVQIVVVDDAQHADLRLASEHQYGAEEQFFPLWQDRYHLLIPMQHPLAHQASIPLSALNGAGFIERRYCENKALFHDVLRQHQLATRQVAEVDNEEWALSLVEAGLGLTIAPLPEKTHFDQRFKALPLGQLESLQDIHRRVGLVAPLKTATLGPLASLFATLQQLDQ